MGGVSRSLRAGMQTVKDNSEVLGLKQEIIKLKTQIDHLQAQGADAQSADSAMGQLTEQLAEQSGKQKISLELIDRDENQPRTVFSVDTVQERVESMRRYGQKSPIILIPQESGRYKLFDGELRNRAAKILGWSELDSVFMDAEDLADELDLFESQVVTSIHARRLHDLDLAFALIRLLVSRHQTLEEKRERIPTILNTALRRLERSEELSDLAEIRLAKPEEQDDWLDSLSFKEIEEKQIFRFLLELQLNPLSINRNVFPLLKLSEDLGEVIRNQGIESSKARELNKLNSSQLRMTEEEALEVRQSITAQAIDEKLSLTKVKSLVNTTIAANRNDIDAKPSKPTYIRNIEKIEVGFIEDTEALTALKKLLNAKLREVNIELKNRD